MKLQTLTPERFKDFGTMLILDENDENPVFQIPVKVADAPWRIALLKILPKEIVRLERHSNSRESFEPMNGWTVLFVARPDTPDEISAFVLDCPICLYENVWHGVITLTDSSMCKLTENLDVPMEFHELPSALTAACVFQ